MTTLPSGEQLTGGVLGGSGYWYDENAARLAVEFFPKYLRHVRGEWAGTPFLLADWQAKIVGDLYGWKREDGTRRYRKALIYIPRKNGKSSMGAGFALKGLCADAEPGAEVYGAAYKQEQAGIIYALAAAMVEASPQLRKRCRVHRSTKRISVLSTASFYWAIPNDAAGSHGFNAHMTVFDELHTQKTEELYEALTTSQASRRQPLTVFFTTAGYNLISVAGREYEYAVKVRDGVIVDEAYYPAIFELPAKADFRERKFWRIANPGLGMSVKEAFLAEQVQTALTEPTKRNTILRYHFNQWTGAEEAWIGLEKWDTCAVTGLTRASLKGLTAIGSVDLASTIDLAAKALLFPPDLPTGKFRLLLEFYVPAKNVKDRADRDRVPYQTWIDQGWITPTEGDVIDYDFIKDRILNRDRKEFNLKDIAVDPWNASQFMGQLKEQGATVTEFGQGYKSMSPPTKELERIITSGRIEHEGSPVMRWMMSNVMVSRDEAGNVKMDKKKSREKIDGPVALVMALGRHLDPSVKQGWNLKVAG